MENIQAIEASDFMTLGEQLRANQYYLNVAQQLDSQGKKRIILDRDEKEPYLVRYYYLNYRPFARITIHNILLSDRDGLHDHPWDFQTYILSGGYWETTPHGKFWRGPGYHGISKSTDFHRLELDPNNKQQTWTLFMMGPRKKEWGFLDVNNNWIYWEEYLEKRKLEESVNG